MIGRGVDRQADVAVLGEAGPADVDCRPHAHRHVLGPAAVAQAALDVDRGRERVLGVAEDGEELIAVDIHLVAADPRRGLAQHPPNVAEQCRIGVVELVQEGRGALDVGEQEGQLAGRERRLLRQPQLPGDEPDRDDAVAPGRVEQPGPRPVPGRLVLEDHLVEAGQGVPNVCRVVDRQAPPAFRIDVGERPIRELRSIAGSERRHGSAGGEPTGELEPGAADRRRVRPARAG
jgi:hypothetical protein